uniref:Uncharacterized protein n=1 Tax=Anguilla anguilla TaxID=7936 RepID=A0A0E9XSI8_ANGAN
MYSLKNNNNKTILI